MCTSVAHPLSSEGIGTWRDWDSHILSKVAGSVLCHKLPIFIPKSSEQGSVAHQAIATNEMCVFSISMACDIGMEQSNVP